MSAPGPAPTPTPQLAGRWLCEEVLQGSASLPTLGRLMTSTRIRSRLHIEQEGPEGAELALRWRVRELEIDSGTAMTRIEVSPASIEAMAETTRAGRLEATLDGGVRLVLPTALEEQHLELRFRGLLSGTQRVLMRTTTRFVSTGLDERRIAGEIEWSGERRILRSSNPLLRLAPDVQPNTGPGASWFSMWRDTTL